MPFKNILVALDGSDCSQIAANYGIWLAGQLNAKLSGQHVVDPRVVDLFVAPEFAEELGFKESMETFDKVFRAFKKIGVVILDLFSKQAFTKGLTTDTYLDAGYTIEEIIKRADAHDLVVIGHRGRGHQKAPTELTTGSVAERVAFEAKPPVLIAMRPVDTLEQILVAYDGSEPARGALLAAESLAVTTGKKLKAMTVVHSSDRMAEAKLTVEQGESYLREFGSKNIFEIREGHPARTLIDYANTSNSLLVIGAYGFRSPDSTVLGSTTTYVARRTKSSVLIYR